LLRIPDRNVVIEHRAIIERAEVLHLVVQAHEVLPYELLQLVAGLVRSDRDLHGFPPYNFCTRGPVVQGEVSAFSSERAVDCRSSAHEVAPASRTPRDRSP